VLTHARDHERTIRGGGAFRFTLRRNMRNRSWLWLASSILLVACSAQGSSTPKKSLEPLPFKTVGDRLGVWDGQEHVPVFVKGVNFSVAVPGTLAGELAATREQYDRWLDQIGQIGFNAIRVYTLHYPRFYDAVAAYNQKHPDAPIYVLHGIWLDEDDPTDDLFTLTDLFDSGIHELVDCAHGNCKIPERRGRAFGNYTTDITPWIMGWIIGREVSPDEIQGTNTAHADFTEWQGDSVSIDDVTPSEAWFTQRLDNLVTYEHSRYGVDRPVSVSSWPTLDPLHHPSELGNTMEDRNTLDFENIDTSRAPGGFFASYHAYSYYPDFMTHDEAYQSAMDREGQNTYYGYLMDLKHHYATHPLLIAEFGVPTSWGNSHFGGAGMNHGGENEVQQGQYTLRQMQDAIDAHCAGAAVFAWIDEWWKRTWIVDELAFPRSDYPLWHNITSPEQNFGIIQFQLPDPSFTRWPATTSDGRIASIAADYDAEYFHLQIKLKQPLAESDELSIGIDTYGDDVGESVLPDGTHTEHRNELALVLDGTHSAQLYVTQPYDLYGIWHGNSEDTQLYHSVASDTGAWAPVRWENNLREYPDHSDQEVDEVGKFVIAKDPADADIRTGVIFDGATIHVRFPWTLLQFTDPTTRSVMADDRSTPSRPGPRETQVSDGIAFGVELGDQLLETSRFKWDGWTKAPATTERLKKAAQLLKDGLPELIDEPPN
jgi:hypothetical protein